MLQALKAGTRGHERWDLRHVVGVDDQKVQLRVADQVKIEIAKHAIAGLQSES
jgi:hypothetical protein